MGRALGPVAAVTRTARRIASTGHFEERLPLPRARDELAELTATFNEMIDRLGETIRRQREFIADASHELRGPLMVIRGNLDLLRLGLPGAEREASVKEATEEANRMARLVGDFLFLAEGDAREIVSQERIALDEVVREVFARALDVDRGTHDVRLPECEPTTVCGDRDRLAQLLWNLVENALRYTPGGGEVLVSLLNHGAVAELSVADRGIGISAEQLPRIFERFYRADKARSRAKGGTGLGLAIVKQIAEAHGGQVRVRSEPGEGSTFTVVLPTRASVARSSSAR
jgi:two-component system, OmpR family, sensor kinase